MNQTANKPAGETADQRGVVTSEPKPLQAQDITPMGMINTAVQRGASMEELAKLMDLQERWEANEARKAYVAAMSEFRAQCPAISKTRDAHNSKYAGLAETIDAIKGLMSSCGLSHSWRTNQKDSLIEVTCCITHKMGHSECTTLAAGPDTSGSKNSIQAVGSTVAYLERYTLFAALGLASKEMDDDGIKAGAEVERVSDDQAANIEALADEVGADIKRFLGYLSNYTKFPLESVSEIPAKMYNEAIKALEAKRK